VRGVRDTRDRERLRAGLAQRVAEGPRVVRAVMDGEGLVDGHPPELGGRCLDGVLHGDRLAIGGLHDEVAPGPDMFEDGGGARRGPRNAGHGHSGSPPPTA